jgi:hypothetical protein
MQKGVNRGVKIAQLKFGGPKSHNCETLVVKIAQLKFGGPKSHNCETCGTKTAFKPFFYLRD